MTKKKKFEDMTHEELFFYMVKASDAYYEYANSDEELNTKTERGKSIIRFAHYIDKLHQLSEEQGVSI